MAAVSFIPFVALYFLSHPAVSANDNSKISCPPSFPCRNSGPLLYFPFYNANNPQCGLCSVVCPDRENHVGEITCGNENFLVTEISSTPSGNGSVEVYEPEFTKRSLAGDCSGFRNFSLPNSPSISFTIPHNLTLFKCSKSYRHSPPALDEYLNYTGCDDFNLYYKQHNVSASAHSFHDCETILRPLTSTPSKKKTEPGENDDDLLKLLNGTYHVEFQVTKVCLKCHGRGDQCDTTIDQKFHCKAKKKGPNLKLILPLGSIALVAMIFLFYYIEWKHLSKRILCLENLGKIDDQNVEAFLKSFGSLVSKRYSYLEIKKITNSFKNKLGEGGFGGVYKGKLHDGQFVAVKLLKESKGDGEQFINEVASISRTSHVNIVSLLGFCYENGKKALIFEFMANGSLDKFIYDRNMPNEHELGLEELYKIVVGVAKGLEYLHLGCKTRILHFDIKPHNILLDENFCPKISDFGLAKQCLHKQSIISLFGTRGTIGYIAPELFSRNYGGVSYKVDVYSYGMMILDMIVGRKNWNDSAVDCSSDMYFPDWKYKHLEKEQEIGHHCITSEEEDEKARKMIIVGLWCIQTDPLNRPSMTKVLEMLEGSLHSLHVPPKPVLFSINGPVITHCSGTYDITLCSSNVS
ncbi:LEAF RUST 10 DISEASE-RESISTANCE LOCUS RECEPTOR-LIKE PROTEIN KINASE-like 2.4 isoform X4 [Diospyros lotus]|uniref:LEAF RUST 10 DISEASE-RESISTANCE LOCUS RECEPTOR-LIKE PROTEIN KINASE-like 2.4 isoform X4 n=1 Tax=Diospyros lotus TaxID=55363 RepID=UPI00224C7FEB|nr:LEAF RUST 10 DISEASE-RESISTANCE LOCUS RECEPTOR-LIKE PROTEIN KINASE-like 2.4 isoform X4 [Diospyros lotus]